MNDIITDKYKLIEVDNGVRYIINPEINNVLHIVLSPHKEFSIDMRCLCWSSDNIKMKNASILQRFLQGPEADIAQIINDSDTLATASISQGNSGHFTVIDINNTNGYYVHKDTFLGATMNITIEPKSIPIIDLNVFKSLFLPLQPLSNRTIYCQTIGIPNSNNNSTSPSINGGVIFLQSDSIIMKKTLQSHEKFHLSYSCVVAIESTCTITEVQISTTSLVYILQIHGPGNVYMSTSGKRQILQYISGNQLQLQPHRLPPANIILQFCISLMILGLIYVTIELSN